MKNCKKLKVKGKVVFGPDVILEGDVEIYNEDPSGPVPVVTGHIKGSTDRLRIVREAFEKAGQMALNCKEKTLEIAAAGKEKTLEIATAGKEKTLEIAADKRVQVTAASATGGAVVLGTGGAAAGFATGGVIGAVVGVVPAIFTLGLSIPVFAAIGSTCGFAVGATVGGATGLVGGGATGYGAYTKREAIGSACSQTMSRVDEATKYVKERASNSAGYVRSKLVGTTGGTMD